VEVRPHGLAVGRHVAVLGEWDPLGPQHEQLFVSECDRARGRGLPLLVVTFEPSPISLLMGARSRPPFDDVVARLAAQARWGASSRIVVALTPQEVQHAGVDELLDALAPYVEIEELALGVRQNLGTQDRGNDAAIRAAAARRGIGVRRLDGRFHGTPKPDARTALVGGRLGRAVELIGRPLYWSRPEGGRRTLPWPPGSYRAVPLRGPHMGAETGPPVTVELVEEPGGATFRWPDDDAPWLGFVSGPQDLRDAGTPMALAAR